MKVIRGKLDSWELQELIGISAENHFSQNVNGIDKLLASLYGLEFLGLVAIFSLPVLIEMLLEALDLLLEMGQDLIWENLSLVDKRSDQLVLDQVLLLLLEIFSQGLVFSQVAIYLSIEGLGQKGKPLFWIVVNLVGSRLDNFDVQSSLRIDIFGSLLGLGQDVLEFYEWLLTLELFLF